MNIYYIYHSCFVVEDEKNILIFDYYETPKKSEAKIDILDFVKRKDKKVSVFSYKNHGIIYSRKIMRRKNEYLLYLS